MRVASTFILSSGTVGISITTLPCLNAAPWWGAGELTSRAATWTGGCSGRLRTCTQWVVVLSKNVYVYSKILKSKLWAVVWTAHHSGSRPNCPRNHWRHRRLHPEDLLARSDRSHIGTLSLCSHLLGRLVREDWVMLTSENLVMKVKPAF